MEYQQNNLPTLILAAHGSREPGSNLEIEQLAAKLQERCKDRYRVWACFLELAEPSIEDTIDKAISTGAQSVIVLPYFLAAGRHVNQDIPKLVESARRRHPATDIRLLDHFGSFSGVLNMLTAAI